MKKYIAEALGTGALTLIVGLSLAGSFPITTPVLAALTLGLFVYSVGSLSGTHINPAVTLGVWSIGKIQNKEAAYYVASQLVGATVALLLLSELVVASTSVVKGDLSVGLAEMVGAFFFTFGIASVVYGKAPGTFSGVVVGGSLLLGIAFAVTLGSGGILNPAVAYGISSLNLMYVLGPIIGAVLEMQAYKYLQA